MFDDAEADTQSGAPSQKPPRRSNFENQLETSLNAAAAWSTDHQHPDGYWVGRLESNVCMEAEWILALWVVGLDDHPLRPRLAEALISTQREDGSWEIYHDAPAGDINTTVEAYAALRSMGYDAGEPFLQKAQDWIASKGGLRHIRVFTRYWLALIGEWPWEKTPNVPPEVIRFPHWFAFSIYNFAQWARATMMPIAVLCARRTVRALPPENRLDALFPDGRDGFDYTLPKKAGADGWDRFFRTADRCLHGLQSFGMTPGRNTTVKRALEWIIQHQDADGVWGGIQPPWIYSLMALVSEGYALDHPVVAKALAALDDPRWRVDVGSATFIQASTSPVWDTVLTLLALDDADVLDDYPDEVRRAVQWVLDQQVLRPGDWQVKVPDIAPGGWAFEYKNYFYPDTDDTAVALIVLSRLRDDPHWREQGIETAISRGVDWLLGMQSKNGGWGAFDKDNNKTITTRIPFCDFGEALDPPSVDVTAHIVEAFGKLGFRESHPAMARALAYLKAEQEADGSWFGRWGVNYVYGTGAVLPALEALHVDMTAPWVTKAADWLIAMQQKDGGWGESCASYMDPAMAGRGPTTASQTAWAIMGLAAVNRPGDRDAMERGIGFLMDQQVNGTWQEPEYTGTGFPGYGVGATIKLTDPGLEDRLSQGVELSRAFMINYNLYRHYFPLMAFGRVRALFAQ
ncbi:MAG: squalene--hopene cyclase [Pseudomonadota bacterium]